jgi:hypothetical protein
MLASLNAEIQMQEMGPPADRTAVESAIAQLTHKRSPKRRAAAKRLARLRDPAAGPALLAALQKEMRDRRTWETQYKMIMALGLCSWTPALSYLWELTQEHFDATMVYLGLGDAIVRLGRVSSDDSTPVLRLLATGNDMLIAGAAQAAAMLRLKLTPRAVEQFIAQALRVPTWHPLRGMVALAAAGWSGPHIEAFLADCADDSRTESWVQRIARAAQQKRYAEYDPL